MKVKSNIRAGAGANSGGVNSGGASGGGHNSSDPVPVYVAPVGRCVGI